MLSRVASHLYWLSRYLERAENMARILDVGQSLALLSARAGDEASAAEPLVITDSLQAFEAGGNALTPENVARFLAWDPQLPSSIVNCIESTRENARSVRGSITSEMWETINDTWLQMQAKRRGGNVPIDTGFFDWVKERSHLVRGVTFATLRRDQPYHFIRLGTLIERADNTARILSVKQARNAAPDPEASEFEYYSLSAVLRSVSALEAYRDTYHDTIGARRVAELLIFDEHLPRSLRFCAEEIGELLAMLPRDTGRRARRIAEVIHAGLAFGALEDVHKVGLDAFLDQFIKDNIGLGDAVQSSFMETQ
jgi:uncharacterized alpha-E superfamily protein